MDDEVDRSRHTHPQTNPNPILKRAASDGMAHRLRRLPCRTSPASLDFISPVLDVFYTAAPAAVHLLKRRGAYPDIRVTQKGTHTSILTMVPEPGY